MDQVIEGFGQGECMPKVGRDGDPGQCLQVLPQLEQLPEQPLPAPAPGFDRLPPTKKAPNVS